jgi:hypothetical protein
VETNNILVTLNKLNKHIYEGTASSDDVKKRRAKNKKSRSQRKRNKK